MVFNTWLMPRRTDVTGARMFCSRLLQENGYHVLRFLCEDVGKRLDEVLDAIVRALSHRCTRRITEKGRI
jgi:very-short-patch-repair endonuclease